MEEEHEKMASVRARRKRSSVGSIVCCFTGATQHHRHASFDASSSSTSQPIPRRSPSGSWFKSRPNDSPEMKGKCRSFISRMAGHRRHSSADFGYDPLSYALNFDDDASSPTAEDDFRAMSFNARLPVSPPVPRPLEEGGSDDLRRGFEALSARLKETSPLGAQQRSNKDTELSPSTAAHAEDPVAISSNREILVQFC